MELIHRDIEPELLKMSESYPVVTIIGPRQSGKTTLVKSIFSNKPYVSLENIDERRLAELDPRSFLAKYPQGAIFDEIQRLPELLSYMQGIVDEKNVNGMFILTGSHQLKLQESISQSLAGRTAILKLLPFTISELKNNKINFSLEEYIFYGMYPRIFKENIEPTKYYRDYIQTYVERDVRQIVNVKDLNMFQHFLKLCAGRIGQVFNSHSLSNELGITHNTVRSWISVLEASFLIFRLHPYYENFGKRLVKAPKLYFTDVGLASYLLDITSVNQISRDPLRGNLVENMIILECIKHQLNQGYEPSFYYYRDSNSHEVDLIYKTGHELIPIEIKSSMTFTSEFLKGLRYFKDISQGRCTKGYLIYAGEQEQDIGFINVLNYLHVHKIFSHIIIYFDNSETERFFFWIDVEGKKKCCIISCEVIDDFYRLQKEEHSYLEKNHQKVKDKLIQDFNRIILPICMQKINQMEPKSYQDNSQIVILLKDLESSKRIHKNKFKTVMS